MVVIIYAPILFSQMPLGKCKLTMTVVYWISFKNPSFEIAINIYPIYPPLAPAIEL